jgi:hypothetical protein
MIVATSLNVNIVESRADMMIISPSNLRAAISRLRAT